MTLHVHQLKDEGMHRAECAECGNNSFHADIINLPSGAVRIKQIECAVCGDVTEFKPSAPRDLVTA